MWLLWQLLSNQKKLVDNNFEYCLILEYKDKPAIDININIRAPDEEHNPWLRIMHTVTKASRKHADNTIQDKTTLRLSGFIDLDKLLQLEPSLSHIYLWTSTSLKREYIYLETLCFEANNSLEKQKLRTLNANKNFVELYPISSKDQPSERYSQIEDQRIDSEGFQDLLALIRGDKEDFVDDTAINSNSLVVANKNNIQNVFSKKDLKDLEEGFNEWQRVHGKNELIDKLPESLINKISTEFEIVFWTSGQGVSNMIKDNNPPRHTMVLSIVQKSSKNGIGYCIQRPTSLDNVWTHKQWHKIKYSDSEILEVLALD